MAGFGHKSMHNGMDYNSGNKLPCFDSNFMMNTIQEQKFHKSERESTVLSSHNDSISIVKFFTCHNSMEIGEPRHQSQSRVIMMKSTITFLRFYLL